MAVEMVLLGLLRQGPRHGYDLTREFLPETVLGDIVRLEPSLLYANLKKLERDGLVRSTVQQQGSRPARRMLELTDLGVETLSALEEGLLAFPGCAVVISHDRWFLDRIATHILAFEGNSEVVWFEGNFQEYMQDLQRRKGEAAAQPHRIKYKPLTR